MKVRNYCSVCHETFDEGECPQCYSKEFVTVYECGVCKKTWFWRSSEKECCAKKKEERRKE